MTFSMALSASVSARIPFRVVNQKTVFSSMSMLLLLLEVTGRRNYPFISTSKAEDSQAIPILTTTEAALSKLQI